jgi:excisionase family DNA binding protein
MTTNFKPEWLRIREAARMLDVSTSTVRRWLYREKLDGFKVGRVVRVDRRSIERLAEAHRYAHLARGARPSARRWLSGLSRFRDMAS